MDVNRSIKNETMRDLLKRGLTSLTVTISEIILHLINKHPKIREGGKCMIVTVAFNRSELIELQLESLKTHLNTEFDYLIYDNSTETECSKKLNLLNLEKNVHYFKPKLKLIGKINPSLDHAMALNWCSRLIANLAVRPQHVLYLDHDIFLTNPWSIPDDNHLKSVGLFAPEQKRGKINYFWPGLMLVNTNIVNLRLLSFLPEKGLDTGGRLGRIAETNKIRTQPIPHSGYINTKTGEKIEYSDPFFVELLMSNLIIESYGPWLHLINGSGWRGSDNQNHSFDYIAGEISKTQTMKA